MKKILILCTHWSKDYWERQEVAPYHPKGLIQPVQHLRNTLPIPAIGVYIKKFSSEFPCFLIVKNIDVNEKGELQFYFQFISKMEGVESSQFLSEIEAPRDLFFTISQEKILDVLRKFNIKPPEEWQGLLEERLHPSWQDYIGKYYLDILGYLSNIEYEDRVAAVFTALGFEVEQLGYKRRGEYPDGIIYSTDFAIIYDCKNRPSYVLSAKDKRAMVEYVKDARRRIEEQRRISKVYFAFIVHSYEKIENVSEIERETSTKGLLLTSESLLYLLFKKLTLGRKFLLTDFEKLVLNQVITIEKVEEVYKKID